MHHYAHLCITSGRVQEIIKRGSQVPRKLAVKRLTASDLTLFKWHFENRPAGKQKAFNLDTRILVGDFYPQLGEPSNLPYPRFPLDLYLFGPGLAPANNLQRKILKQQKNWRLNGELIHSPEDDPRRYEPLVPGDFAFLEFSGSVVPTTARVVLIGQSLPADAAIHRELVLRYPDGSMWSLDEGEVSDVLDSARPPSGHPLYDWVESEALEDAVLGGVVGVARIASQRAGRGISPEEFLRARKAAELTGVSGEEFLNEYLLREVDEGRISGFEWTSSINAISPFDFRLREPGGAERVVDAKSTSGVFSNPIHLSLAELRRAVEGLEPYDIFRLYAVTEGSAKLRIARDVGPALRAVLQTFDALPAEVSVDSVSVHPDLLAFEPDEIDLTVPSEDRSS